MSSCKSITSESSRASENGCDTECGFIRSDALPFGITIIPGSGKLTEFPISNENLNNAEGANFFDAISALDLCPRAFPPTSICVGECPEFAAASQINFINGDLIISEPAVVNPVSDLLQALQSSSDLLDIFPNLLGINGNLYIVGTSYRRITGFERLRFVTGSIVIVNNQNLITIPSFPSLLSVGGLVTVSTPASGAEEEYICGRSAIIIANNSSLRKISGFETLRQVKDGIFIANNACLTHICGFIHLYRTDRIVIKSNPKLSKIVGFGYIDTLNNGLYILDNGLDGQYDLVINAFVALETSIRVIVIGNAGLKSLKLDSLNFAGFFVVRSNPQLEDVSTSVHFINELSIENNRSLLVIRFPCLREVNEHLNINSNCSLLCIEGFDELRRVGHGIMLADNKQLVELRGFNKLKYIGSSCVSAPLVQQASGCSNCGCTVDVSFDWTTIIRLPTVCGVVDTFPVDFYDDSAAACAYQLPLDFFRLVCNAATPCAQLPIDQDIPRLVSYSLIIFRNQRLKAIGGFCNLKHIESNMYIIGNPVLHTIQAFGQLAYALDIWIRNNQNLKYIIAFANLLSIRDFVVYETNQLINLDNIKSLEFAQLIATEARSSRSIKYPNHPLPSVLGYTLYYAYDNRC